MSRRRPIHPTRGDGKEEPTESEQHTQEVEDTFERD